MSELVQAASVADVMSMADVVVKSGLFPMFKTREAAAAMMLLCRSKGLDPMTAIERYHIVQGRPVMRADAMLGEFVRMGGKVEWIRRDDQEAKATFSHPLGGTVTVSWTIEQARAAKLTGKDVWSQYPRQMLHARCVSEGVRSILPGATNGLYTPEEAENMEPVRHRVKAEVIEPVRAEEVPQIGKTESKPIIAITPPVEHHVEERRLPNPKAIQIAMQDFAEAAQTAGRDVLSPSGKPSKAKMIELAQLLCAFDGMGFDKDDVSHWYTAIDQLAAEDPAGMPDDVSGIEDPFAEN